MRKKTLEKRLARIKAKIKKLAERGLASEDANEVRSINEQLAELNEDAQDIQEELDEIAEEEARQNDPGKTAGEGEDDLTMQTRGQNVQTGMQQVNANIVGAFGQGNNNSQTRENTDPFATMEYRQAFMNYVQTGVPIPTNLYQRDGMPQNTTQLGATIPTTVLNEFINELRAVYGNLYSKVRKLNVPGGVKIPIAKLQAKFKWITEDTVAPRDDGGKIDEYVEFSYNIGEIRVSQTLLSSIVTIDLFEREIVKVMIMAYLQAMDSVIVKGTGKGQPLGILNDPRVLATGNVVEMTAAQINDWKAWKKNFFAKLPLGYRAGEFVFPLATVDAYLETMSDSNNNPIFHQATGLEVNDSNSHNPNGRFFGREISLVEPDIITDFDSAQPGDVVGVFWQPEEYAINTNLQFGMKRWFDEDLNEWVNKMLTIVDGKVMNPKGIWLIKKKA